MNNGRYSENSEEESRNQCCLIDDCTGVRCRKTSGNAAYSKRIQKTVQQKKLRLSIDPAAKHFYICEFHKAKIQSAKKRRKDSEDESNETDGAEAGPEVDLFSLQVNTLRRYKRAYKVTTRPGMNKAGLADTLMKHFKTLPVKEKETLTYFIYMIKTNSNKLDKNGIGSDAT